MKLFDFLVWNTKMKQKIQTDVTQAFLENTAWAKEMIR